MELLHKIQKELKAPKNQRNNFGGYNYRSCEDILEAVKPLLTEGASLVLNDKIVLIGSRYYVKATATLSDGDQKATATAYAREAETKKGMDESQITGSASSYARKYALNGLLLIDDTKDADTQDNTAHSPKDYKTEIKDLLGKLGKSPATVGEANEIVLALTSLEYKPQNFAMIAERLKIKLEEHE